MKLFDLTAIMLVGSLIGISCQANPTDKDQYTLFNPTPDQLMREMSADRPDATESPYTVDAGHFQFELSLAEYSDNNETGAETLSLLPVNFKVGLLNNVDLQLLLTPYIHTDLDNTNSNNTEGFGDTQLRLKINLWGNDGDTPSGLGNTAFAIMPFVKFPTGDDELTNDHLEGGVIFPLAMDLPGSFGLGVMAEIDFVYNETDDDYGLEFVHSAVLGHDITGELAGYIEYVGIASHDTGTGYRAIGSAGLTYRLNDNWLLDFGATASPSDDADDLSVFAGTTFRL